MKLIHALCLIAFAAACGAPQETAPPRAAILEITGAWASPTPGGVDVSAGYLTIANGTNADDRLTSASSPRAARVEIHEMSMDGDVMRMRTLDTLPAPAGEDVALAPGGMHLMFFGVTQPFVEGEEIAVQLTFEHAGAIEVTLPVRRDAAGN
jgi:copper(I)-binding protein